MRRDTPFLPKLVALFALAYVVWPADLIPDVPFLGWLDDIGFVAFATGWLARAMRKSAEHDRKALAVSTAQSAPETAKAGGPRRQTS